jgi:hypothetical protein
MNSKPETLGQYESASQEDRCAPRAAVSIPSMLRPSGSSAFQVKVTNLSISGFACETFNGLRPGTLCWLTLPGLGSQQAEVVWRRGPQIGCAFANLLNQAVLDLVISRHKPR